MLQGTFSFGALIGFERSTVLQHPKRVYELLQVRCACKSAVEETCVSLCDRVKDTALWVQESTQGDWSNNFIVERCWNMLFGGPDFMDV